MGRHRVVVTETMDQVCSPPLSDDTRQRTSARRHAARRPKGIGGRGGLKGRGGARGKAERSRAAKEENGARLAVLPETWR